MLNRNLFVVICVCLAASVAAFGAPGDSFLFQLPGASSAGARLLGYPYLANPFNPSIDAFGPAGASVVLPKPDGSKFYILGSGSITSLQVTDPNFTNFRSINGLGAPPTSITMSPDGRYLLVGADMFYIVDTNTDQVVGSIPISGSIPGTQVCPICVGLAVSRDAKRAFVLTNSAFGASIQAYDLASHQRVGNPLNLDFGGARSMNLSPLGLLYVTAVNAVYEIDPATLTFTAAGKIATVSTPGPMRFTPDGTTAYFVNFDPSVGGASIYEVNLANHTTASWPPFNPLNQAPIFDDVLIAGNSRIFAFSSASTTLFDVQPAPLSAAESTLSGILPTEKISGVAISNELPSARFLYAQSTNQTQTTVYRVDLSTNTINIQALGTLQGGILQFVGVPPQTGATSFLQYNNLQVLAPGATSKPLIARVLDQTGRPVNNISVTFTTDPTTGVIINSPSGITNADGFVQSTVTLPSTPGTYTITITAGTATAPFTVTIPGAGGGGGGGGGGINQVSIVSGDGQLLNQFVSTVVTGNSLFIQVVDTTGLPLQGIPVAFTITQGQGNISNPTTTTDAMGLAFTDFGAAPPQFGQYAQMNIINASTPLGSVNFTETSLNAVDIFGNQSDPIILLLTPSANDNFRVSIGAGETVANAVTAQISTPANPSVLFLQGVGIVIRTPFDNNLAVQAAPPANCVGSTLSDQFGIAKCTVKANCQIGVFPVRYTVGFQRDFFGTINVTKGTASLLTILNGNNQTGRAGDTLPIALSASVSDKCANIVGGVPVTWSVVSGSATLVNTISVSSNNGSVSTQVKLGQTPGQVKISVAIGNLTQVIFTLTNQVVVASLTLTGGNNQTTVTGQTFPQPLTFTVKDVSGNPVPGIVVNFAVVSGSAGVNPTSATTNAQGNASTTVTAGVPAGAIVISGSYSTFSASATLTSRSPGPGVTTSGFVNAASFQPGLSPCGLATVIGTGIATGIQGTVLGLNLFGGYSSSLNGLSLSINGVTGPIYSLSNSNGKEQATFQVPCETAPGFATVVVTFNGGSTTVSNVPVVQAQPGIFTFVDINGTTYADVISAADGSYVSINNPARKGGSYFMFVTGLGLVSPATATNRAGIPGQNVNVQLTVGVGTGGAALNSAQYATGFIGIYLVGFTIPTDAQSGDRNLSLGAVVNGTTVFSNSTLIRIQ